MTQSVSTQLYKLTTWTESHIQILREIKFSIELGYSHHTYPCRKFLQGCAKVLIAGNSTVYQIDFQASQETILGEI